jgi:hypothetical protein
MFTEGHSRFIDRLLHVPAEVRLVATRAAQAAGYPWPQKQGPRLMTFPCVAEAIETGFTAFCPIDRQGSPIGREKPRWHVGKG